MQHTEYGFDTLQLHAGYQKDTTGARAVPIYQTTAYLFENTADAAAQFNLTKPGSIYTRLGNPTTAVLEERLAALEHGVGTVCFASGMAAVLAAIQNLAESGSEVIALSTIYGGTYTLLFSRFEQRYGIKVHQVDPEDMDGLTAAINENTRCVYIETLGNPNVNIPDITRIANIAHENGLPLIADNTFGTPYLIDCKAHGIDITVQSLTKYVGGHGSTMGGSVTDLGTFSFKGNARFSEYNTPDDSYHGIVYADIGDKGYITKLRAGFLRDTGACLSPFNAFLLLTGLETLSLRVERHSQNALAIAKHLASHPQVNWVNYPALPQDRYYARAQQYLPRGCGGIFTFGIKGGAKAGAKFIDSLKLFSHVANVADARSLVVHPASTTHSQLDENGLKAAGITADTIRLSIGLEDVKDLIADLDAAIEAARV